LHISYIPASSPSISCTAYLFLILIQFIAIRQQPKARSPSLEREGYCNGLRSIVVGVRRLDFLDR
jgi:hypothetical protein